MGEREEERGGERGGGEVKTHLRRVMTILFLLVGMI